MITAHFCGVCSARARATWIETYSPKMENWK